MQFVSFIMPVDVRFSKDNVVFYGSINWHQNFKFVKADLVNVELLKRIFNLLHNAPKQIII